MAGCGWLGGWRGDPIRPGAPKAAAWLARPQRSHGGYPVDRALCPRVRHRWPGGAPGRPRLALGAVVLWTGGVMEKWWYSCGDSGRRILLREGEATGPSWRGPGPSSFAGTVDLDFGGVKTKLDKVEGSTTVQGIVVYHCFYFLLHTF